MPGGATRQIAVVVAYLGMIAMNVLANALPLAGRATGDISAMFPIPFTPAGWVFSIWGLIYLGLAIFTVYQALPAQRDKPRLDVVGGLFVVSCIFNVAWLVAWHNVAIVATMVLMLALLATLVAIYERTRPVANAGASGLPIVGTRDGGEDVRASRAWRWAVSAPFSLYLGWITVATVANASIFLYDLGWQPGQGSAVLWSSVLVVVAAGIGAAVLLRRRDPVYVFVLVWAFSGIAAKAWSEPFLATTATVAAGVLVLWALRSVLAQRSEARA